MYDDSICRILSNTQLTQKKVRKGEQNPQRTKWRNIQQKDVFSAQGENCSFLSRKNKKILPYFSLILNL